MKKLLIILSLLVGFSASSYAEDINECKTDIYYGNGVWNEPDDAEENRKELEDEVLVPTIVKGNSLLQAKYGKVKLAYNWGQGTLFDVLETYYQLREAGQLEGIGYFAAMAALTGDYKLVLNALVFAELMEPFTRNWEQGNVEEMWEKYYDESFKLGHRVMLVSHSQGNLFANRIHDKINPTEYRTYFANVQVASPASEVKAVKGSYVTLFGDLIINPIPNSMSPNAHGDLGQLKSAGHAFVSAYLSQQDPYEKIVSRIKGFLPTLDTELSQWDTEGEPINKDTCEEKIKVKHSFDLAVEMPLEVYPFNASKKLYQVNGEWVKASCGGENILGENHDIPTWDGKQDNECLMIDNLEEEKIGGGCRVESLFDNSDEGWMILGDAQQGGSNPNYMGGYIQAVDDVIGGIWYYSAPSKFGGDLSGCYGGSFAFDLMQSRTDNQFVSQDIIIYSRYGIVSHRFGYAPGTSWTSFKKEMIETDWDTSLTEEEFKKILSSVISIKIRGEYRVGYDIGSLDNVIIRQKE